MALNVDLHESQRDIVYYPQEPNLKHETLTIKIKWWKSIEQVKPCFLNLTPSSFPFKGRCLHHVTHNKHSRREASFKQIRLT